MKRLNIVFRPAIRMFIITVALFGAVLASTGCNNGAPTPAPAIGAVNPYGAYGYGAGMQAGPGGSAIINFAAGPQSTIYTGTELMAGPVGYGNCGMGCFQFTSTTMIGMQWSFTQAGTQLSPAQVGAGAPPMTNAVTVASKYEPGNALIVSMGSGYYQGSTVYGQVQLSANYMRANFPSGMPAPIGIAFDIQMAGQNSFGGVLIYTSQDMNGYHGAFFAL